MAIEQGTLKIAEDDQIKEEGQKLRQFDVFIGTFS